MNGASVVAETVRVLVYRGRVLGKFTQDELLELRSAIDLSLDLTSVCEWNQIILIVSQKSGFSYNAIMGRRRYDRLAFARQLAMALIYERTGMSLHEVGRIFGRDHGTVLYATRAIAICRQVKDYRNNKRSQLIAAVESSLANAAKTGFTTSPHGDSASNAVKPRLVDPI